MRPNIKTVIIPMITIVFLPKLCIAEVNKTGIDARLNFEASHDDNIYKTNENQKKSDKKVTFNPNISFSTLLGKHELKASYNGEIAKYNKNDDANYGDHLFQSRIKFDHSLRLSTQLEGSYIEEHQDPGTINRIQTNLTEFNIYNEKRLGASLFYGTNESTGRIELSYKLISTDFKNNELDFLDQEKNIINSKFIYRYSDKTEIYIQYENSENDYNPPDGFTEQDNTNNLYKIGFFWKFANKLATDINIGYQDREFTNSTYRSNKGLTYDGKLTWQVSELTTLDVTGSRQAIDSTLEDVGSYTRTQFTVNLEHELTNRINISLSTKFFNDDIIAVTNRNDKRYSFEIKTIYDITDALYLDASFRSHTRNSTLVFAEYKSNIIGISFTYKIN